MLKSSSFNLNHLERHRIGHGLTTSTRSTSLFAWSWKSIGKITRTDAPSDGASKSWIPAPRVGPLLSHALLQQKTVNVSESGVCSTWSLLYTDHHNRLDYSEWLVRWIWFLSYYWTWKRRTIRQRTVRWARPDERRARFLKRRLGHKQLRDPNRCQNQTEMPEQESSNLSSSDRWLPISAFLLRLENFFEPISKLILHLKLTCYV